MTAHRLGINVNKRLQILTNKRRMNEWDGHGMIVGALSEKRIIIKIFIITLQSVSCRVVLFGQKRKKKMRKIQFITCASLIYSVQIAICRSNHNVYFLNPQINFILEKNDSLFLSSLTSQNGKTQKKSFVCIKLKGEGEVDLKKG